MASTRAIDLLGKKFGRLLVLERAPNKKRCAAWRCKCDCGKENIVAGSMLTHGRIKSCGCLSYRIPPAPRVTHGYTVGGARSIYRIWVGMLQRCEQPNNAAYKDYGGRGIKVCDRWHKFENFLADMGERPRGKTLDRYPNNDGNYEPGNCRWATMLEQQANRRSTRFVEIDGLTLPLAVAAERKGLNRVTVSARVNRYGWSLEKALSTPARKLSPRQ